MATDNKTSVLVDELLPEFLDTDGPKFKAFVRAYYEWLETTGQITDRSKNLLNYNDIDNTDAEFIKYFQREVMADFPQEVITNKSLLISRIKSLYRSKGSEQAYKFLFRLLYDDEIDFYYPGEDMLRVSDGRWVQESSLRIGAPLSGNLFDIDGKNITGASSGATAKVDRVVATLELGIEVFEIFLVNIRGTFQDAEVVTADGGLSGTIISSSGPLQRVLPEFGGSLHRVGDRVSFISTSGLGANGAVLTVDDSTITPTIISGGSGYTTGSIITLSGGTGTGAEFRIDSINNTEVIPTFDDTVSDLSGTRIDANTYITSNTGTISSNLAIANSSTALSAALGTTNRTVGTISAMSAITRGSGYTIVPTVSIREDVIADQNIPDGSGGIKGFNANVLATSTGGSITSVSVDNPGTGYVRTEPISIVNLSRTAQNADGSGRITGIVNYDGKYIDTKGFVSWNNRIQDSNYYQQFSYVLRTDQSIDTYREIVKSVIHPAGVNLFADLRIHSNAAISFSANTYVYYSIEFAVLDSIEPTLAFGTSSVTPTISLSSIASTTAISSDHSLGFDFTLPSIASTAVIPNPSLELGFGDVNVPTTTAIGTPTVLQIGTGTISNFSANTIADLTAEQISDYDGITISALPGNKIFDGIGTNFTSQLSTGSTIILSNVNGTGEEITLTVGSIDDANTLAVSANVAFSNGDLVLVSDSTFFYSA